MENSNAPTAKQEKTRVKKAKVFNSITILIVLGILIISGVLVAQLLVDNGIIGNKKFINSTSINGIDVGGMDKNEAVQMISSKMMSVKDEIEIRLRNGDKEWILSGSDFNAKQNMMPIINNSLREDARQEKTGFVRNTKPKAAKINVSYRHMLDGFEEKLDKIIKQVDAEPVEQRVVFNPNSEPMFSLSEGKNGVKVDKNALIERIDEEFKKSKTISVEIPTTEIPFEIRESNKIENIKLRSSFATDYSSSVDGRKNNVNVALGEFNGMVINPGEEVSFNDVTGEKTPERGYQKAKIILNGVYVDGYGGGACQASTTLYNALILADVEILEVNPHSLPVSYVPLAFDAMVSEGYSDLKFKNNFETPIYIKTWGDETKAHVEIYGEPLGEGFEIRRRAEFVEALPHDGDTIAKDVNGEYSNQITYVGEYLRIKYPREGYHSKAYIDYFEDGELVGTKLIRDEYYWPQKGLVMEGTETLGEGMIIPENEVKIIPPQSESAINEISVKKKISQENPSNFNP